MSKPVRISLDAMGGDHGPSIVIPGAALALERHPDIRFLVFGDEAVIAPLLNAHPKLKAATDALVACRARYPLCSPALDRPWLEAFARDRRVRAAMGLK